MREGGVMGEAGRAGRDEMCMQKKNEKKTGGGAARGMGGAVCAEWSQRWMVGASQLEG